MEFVVGANGAVGDTPAVGLNGEPPITDLAITFAAKFGVRVPTEPLIIALYPILADTLTILTILVEAEAIVIAVAEAEVLEVIALDTAPRLIR